MSIHTPLGVEALSSVFDFLFIDTEHSPTDLLTLQNMIMATQTTDTCSLVRVANNYDPALVKPVLDMGTDGIIFPTVTTAEEARRAVAACRYPPKGIRGYGPIRASHFGVGYGFGSLDPVELAAKSDEAIIAVMQIEHIDAMDHLDEMLEVEGVDSLLLGANDFAMSMGHSARPGHPEVVEQLERIVRTSSAAGVPIGVVSDASNPDRIRRWMDLGADWYALGSDLGYLMSGAQQARDAVASIKQG